MPTDEGHLSEKYEKVYHHRTQGFELRLDIRNKKTYDHKKAKTMGRRKQENGSDINNDQKNGQRIIPKWGEDGTWPNNQSVNKYKGILFGKKTGRKIRRNPRAEKGIRLTKKLPDQKKKSVLQCRESKAVGLPAIVIARRPRSSPQLSNKRRRLTRHSQRKKRALYEEKRVRNKS